MFLPQNLIPHSPSNSSSSVVDVLGTANRLSLSLNTGANACSKSVQVSTNHMFKTSRFDVFNTVKNRFNLFNAIENMQFYVFNNGLWQLQTCQLIICERKLFFLRVGFYIVDNEWNTVFRTVTPIYHSYEHKGEGCDQIKYITKGNMANLVFMDVIA